MQVTEEISRYVPPHYEIKPFFQHIQIVAPTPRMARYLVEGIHPCIARSAAVAGCSVYVTANGMRNPYIVDSQNPNEVLRSRRKFPPRKGIRQGFRCIKKTLPL